MARNQFRHIMAAIPEGQEGPRCGSTALRITMALGDCNAVKTVGMPEISDRLSIIWEEGGNSITA